MTFVIHQFPKIYICVQNILYCWYQMLLLFVHDKNHLIYDNQTNIQHLLQNKLNIEYFA